jgi:UDPglucose 6-dehydrogenase
MSKRRVIGIIGLGVVGRAIQAGFAQTTDFRIYDINPELSLNTLEEVAKESDFIFITVPTPMNGDGSCNTSIVEDVIAKLNNIVRFQDTILIIKSTVTPGTTLKLIKRYTGTNIIFNPEFLTARTARLDFINESRIILGGDLLITKEVEKLYRLRFSHTPIIHTDSTTAEMVKYMANCFFATKVSLFNEYYDICEKLRVDFKEAMNLMMMDGRIEVIQKSQDTMD